MKAAQLLRDLGQSIWLDKITRDLMQSGALERYIDELSVSGLTSNLTVADHAIKTGSAYDAAIREGLAHGKSGEGLCFDLAPGDLTQAADLFRPLHKSPNTVDGWGSLKVSPVLAHDWGRTLQRAKDLPARAARPNLFIKLAAPFTVNTVPEDTLKTLAERTNLEPPLPEGAGDCEQTLAELAKAGIDIDALATRLHDERACPFVKSWNGLMGVIASKCAVLSGAALKGEARIGFGSLS